MKIDDIKKDVNLYEFLIKHQFKISRKDKTHFQDENYHYSVFKNKKSDKWVYKNWKTGNSGSIIDFAINELGALNVKNAIEMIKNSENIIVVSKQSNFHNTNNNKKNYSFEERLSKITELKQNNKYILERGFTYKDCKQFCINEDNHHALCFYLKDDSNNIIGVMKKNKNFNQVLNKFPNKKGLWVSSEISSPDIIILCESPIDSISYHLLNRSNKKCLYLATGGTFSDYGMKIIENIAKKNSSAKFILAFDRDSQGDVYSAQVKDNLFENKIFNVVRQFPQKKDWNEDWIDAKKKLTKSKVLK